MSQFLNHAAIAAPRNGSTTHTVTPSTGSVVAGSAFTPTAGRFLVCEVEGAVTSTTPSGWTLPSGGSAVNNTGLYVWHLATAAGGDSISTTHNGSNYPVVFHFYEFPAGTTWVGAAAATAVNPGGGAGPTLSSLTGTNQVYGVGGQAASSSFVGPWAGSWSAGTEIVDTSVAYATTDGYTFGVTEFVDDASSSESSAWTSTNGSGLTAERLMWAVNVPAAYVPPTYPARAVWYTGYHPQLTASLLGSTARVVATDMLLGTPASGSPYALTATTAATSASSSTPTLLATLTATTAATASGSSDPTRVNVVAPLTATTASVSASTSALTLRAALTATSSATSSGSATLTTLAALTATTAATSASTSNPTALHPLTATSAATSASTSTPTAFHPLAATTVAVADGASGPTALHPLTSTTVATAGGSSDPTLIGGASTYPLTSTTAATAGGSSTLTLRAAMASTTLVTAGGSSTATARLAFTATTTATSASSTTIGYIVGLTVTTNAVSGVTSVLAAIVKLTSTTAATADGSSDPHLYAARPPTPGPGLSLTVSLSVVRVDVTDTGLIITSPTRIMTLAASVAGGLTVTTPATALEVAP